MVFYKANRFLRINRDHRILPGDSNNLILSFHCLAVLVLRGFDHSMSTRLAIFAKQRQPDSIAGTLGDRPRRLIYAVAVVVDLGGLPKAIDGQHGTIREVNISLKSTKKEDILTLNPGFEALTFQSGKRWW